MSIQLRGMDARVRPFAEYSHQIADYYGIPVTITSVYRSIQEQRALYLKRQAGQHPYPVAPPGASAHNFGMAWDSYVQPEHQDDWDAIRRWVGFYVPENDRIHGAVYHWHQHV